MDLIVFYMVSFNVALPQVLHEICQYFFNFIVMFTQH